jgi:flagellar biosynthetic protein FliR
VVARFQQMLAVLLLLSLNIHHAVIQVVAGSFRRIRPGMLTFHPESAGGVAALGSSLFRSGLELAAPLVGLLLVTNVGLALLARVAPQTNVFLLGIPITVGLGLLGLTQTLPYFATTVDRLSTQLLADIDVLLGGGLHGVR